MENKNANPSIACTVASCAYHCKEKNHCTLNEIRVGKNHIVTGCVPRSFSTAHIFCLFLFCRKHYAAGIWYVGPAVAILKKPYKIENEEERICSAQSAARN